MGSASDADASFAVSISDRTPSLSLCSESVGLFRGTSDVSVSSTSSESVELEESDACDDCVNTVGSDEGSATSVGDGSTVKPRAEGRP